MESPRTSSHLRTPGRAALLGLLLAAAAALVAGCGGAGGTPGGATLTLAQVERPRSFDPAAGADRYGANIVLNLFDTLYRFKYLARPVELTPNLAAAPPIVSEDGTRFRIRLREGVRFADDEAFPGGRGREVVASDVVYSVKRHFRPGVLSRGRWLWRNHLVGIEAWIEAGADPDTDLPGVRALDRYTVEFRLQSPYPQFVYTLANAYSAVVPREADRHYGAAVGANPVGSGPFLLAHSDGARTILRRNPNFRRVRLDLEAEGYDPGRHGAYGLEAVDGARLPLLDELTIETTPSRDVLWQSYLKGGEVDVVTVPYSVKADVLRGELDGTTAERLEGHHLAASASMSIVYLAFNMEDPELGDVGPPEQRARHRALRCALRASYDWQHRVDTVFGGLGEVFPGVIHPTLPEFDPKLAPASVRCDRKRARALLEQHGWTAENLPLLRFGAEGTTEMRRTYEGWRAGLLEIGYPADRIRFEALPNFGAFSQAMAEGRLQVMNLGWGMDYPDAENLLQLFYGPNASPGPNSANYANAEFDQLFARFRHAPPGPERTAAFRRLNRMLIEDCAFIGSAVPVGVRAWRPDVIAFSDHSIVAGFAWRFFGVRT